MADRKKEPLVLTEHERMIIEAVRKADDRRCAFILTVEQTTAAAQVLKNSAPPFEVRQLTDQVVFTLVAALKDREIRLEKAGEADDTGDMKFVPNDSKRID